MATFRAPNLLEYNREKAVIYARRWAESRNPAYFDFENFGGDCTNFASQCIYAGSGIMNWTPVYGWHYASSSSRTASWTGVNFLYSFLVNNNGPGPFAEVVDVSDVQPGDIVQLSFGDKGSFNHSPVIVSAGSPAGPDNIRTAAHTDNVCDYPLTDFDWVYIRFIHILGVRG